MTTTAPVTPSRVPAVPRGKTFDRKARCFDRAFKAFRDNDPDGFVEEMQEAIEQAVEEVTENSPDQMETIKQAVAEAIAPIMETMDGLRGRMDAFDAKYKDEDKDDEDDEDKKKKTDDADGDDDEDDDDKKKKKTDDALPAELTTDAALRDTAARAEILSPGLRMATTDSLTDAASRGSAIIAHKRAALKNFYRDHAEMAPVLLGMKTVPDFGGMAPASVHLAFMGASEVAKAQNNNRVTKRVLVSDSQPEGRLSPADRNKANREFWASKGA